ncbi:MAG TPA: hypothetical protein VGU66_09510 [Candidatus Elarobacter sp.]|nr:hypothetical protein [Candidatus Elarobacter sp.]
MSTLSQELKSYVGEAIEFAETLPDRYRIATYEALVRDLMTNGPQANVVGAPAQASGSIPVATQRAVVHTEHSAEKSRNPALKGFFMRYGLDDGIVEELAMVDAGELTFFRHPPIKPKARATTDWALLLAFRHGIIDGEFSVSKAEIRDTCKAEQCYDDGNFATTLREMKGLFSNSFTDNETRRRLTPDGERELVQVLKKLAGRTP